MKSSGFSILSWVSEEGAAKSPARWSCKVVLESPRDSGSLELADRHRCSVFLVVVVIAGCTKRGLGQQSLINYIPTGPLKPLKTYPNQTACSLPRSQNTFLAKNQTPPRSEPSESPCRGPFVPLRATHLERRQNNPSRLPNNLVSPMLVQNTSRADPANHLYRFPPQTGLADDFTVRDGGWARWWPISGPAFRRRNSRLSEEVRHPPTFSEVTSVLLNLSASDRRELHARLNLQDELRRPTSAPNLVTLCLTADQSYRALVVVVSESSQ